MLTFELGASYSRADVKEMAGLSRGAKGGNWDTGVVEHQSEFLIFANVGSAARTGHDYNNRWEADAFRWYHRAGSRRSWPSVANILEDGRTVHLFWRSSNSAPFEYAGLARAIEVFDTTPVEILWALRNDPNDGSIFHGPDDLGPHDHHEGSRYQVFVNRYERDRAARQACIDHFGSACVVCNFSFGNLYGTVGKDYIHVHHLVPLSSIGESYQIDPIQDLRPFCPNCHAIAHRLRPPYSVEEIRTMLTDH